MSAVSRGGLLLALGFIFLGSGCSSMVTVSSDPRGATIRINGGYYGVTPNTFLIKDSTFGKYQLTLDKEGYKPVVVTMRKELRVGRLIVDLLFFWPAAIFNAAGPKAVPYDHHYALVSSTD